MTTPARLTEFEIIARFFAPLAKAAPGAWGLLDDAALLTPRPGRDVVVSTDTIVEGVHFPAGEDGATVGMRLLAVGFSDVAAMGAEPTGYTVALTLPQSLSGSALEAWLTDFAAGLDAGQTAIGAALIGGDTVVAPAPLSLTLTAFGETPAGRALRRSGARPGDSIWVSGTIGDAALGLRVLRGDFADIADGDREVLVRRYRRPSARVTLGRALAGVAHAAADVSDGLVADLGHICMASRVAAVLRSAAVPLSAPARALVEGHPGLLGEVLSGGDDYELVFTASAEAAEEVQAIADRIDLPLTQIGHVTALGDAASGPQVDVIGPEGQHMQISRTGFTHL